MAKAPSRVTPGVAQRLKNNLDGYQGEKIDIAAVVEGCLAAARGSGWAVEQLLATPAAPLVALTRRAPAPRTEPARVYISAGIHGDEPAGPLAALELLRSPGWAAGCDVWMCPCLNPAGFVSGRRENAQGADLNRDYLEPKWTETRAHVAWLERQPAFDLCMCLHEDWESHGFYLYELSLGAQPTFADQVISSVEKVCPIERSEVIEGRPATNGIIRPSADPRTRPQWPEAFYLLTHKTKFSCTFEAPSDFPLSTRVTALVAAVKTAVRMLKKGLPSRRKPD